MMRLGKVKPQYVHIRGTAPGNSICLQFIYNSIAWRTDLTLTVMEENWLLKAHSK